MAYGSLAQIETAAGGSTGLRALSDPDNTGASDPIVVAAAQLEADATIDSYAHKRYAVPFAAPSPIITVLSARMTVRILRRDRRMSTTQDALDAEADERWLLALSKGLVSVGVEPLPPKSELVVDEVGERDTLREVSRIRTRGLW